jgi:hypothetical protein
VRAVLRIRLRRHRKPAVVQAPIKWRLNVGS